MKLMKNTMSLVRGKHHVSNITGHVDCKHRSAGWPESRERGPVAFADTGSCPAGTVPSVAPGGSVLVVKNQAAFVSRYGDPGNIAGEFVGTTLSNNRDRLVLEGPVKEIVHSFQYRDEWYPSTDGFGFSLVVADENQDRNQDIDKDQYRDSVCPHHRGELEIFMLICFIYVHPVPNHIFKLILSNI